MAGYADTRELIINTLMGRPAGTEIQPEDHQAFALQITEYIRQVELVAGSGVPVAFAEPDTVPVQPDNGQAVYLSYVPRSVTKNFVNFINQSGNSISVTSSSGEVKLVTLLWNGSYWSSQIVTIDVLSDDSSVNASNIGASDYILFSTSSNYSIGDIVRYDGKLYKFTTEHAAGTWNGTDVELASINSILTSKLTELESQLTDLYGIEVVEKVSSTTNTYITADRSWLVQVQNGHKYRLVINAPWGITQFSEIPQNNAMLYVDNGNGSAYFSHSLSIGFSVMEHTLTADTPTLNIRYRADNGSTVSLTIIDITDQKTLYALDKRIVIDAILSEAFTVDSLTRDSDGNVISGNIKYSDGIAGTIAITRNADGNATSMVATHGTDSYTLSINRNANGDVIKTSIN